MAGKNLKHKKTKKTKRPGLLTSCFMCVIDNEFEDGNSETGNKTLQSTPNMTTNNLISLNYQTSSSYCPSKNELPLANLSPTNVLLSQAYSKKIARKSDNGITPPPSLDSKIILEREHKDELIKTILNKYLAIKREEFLNKEGNIPERDPKSPRQKTTDFLQVECFSSDSSETIILGGTNKQVDTRPKTEFPTKSKSAPTTSAAHDSLADICYKMSRYKQQENKSSDSYITCCSEESPVPITSESTTAPTKKKLELIFNQSSEEMSSCLEDISNSSLQYEISFEKTRTTSIGSRSDSPHSKNDRYSKKNARSTKLSQQLHIEPSAKGEIDGVNGSTSSLKWKLIISKHGHGDVR